MYTYNLRQVIFMFFTKKEKTVIEIRTSFKCLVVYNLKI